MYHRCFDAVRRLALERRVDHPDLNTLGGLAVRLSAAGLGAPPEVRAALVGGLLPGVITVPAMVVTLAQLQEHGLAYEKIG